MVPRRPKANSKLLEATKFPLKHSNNASNAEAMTMRTNHGAPVPCSKATAVANGLPIKLWPWRNVGDRLSNQHIKSRADQHGHKNCAENPRALNPGKRFFRRFRNGFKTGHEVRHDLQRQKNRNQRLALKAGWKFAGEPWATLAARITTNSTNTVPAENF